MAQTLFCSKFVCKCGQAEDGEGAKEGNDEVARGEGEKEVEGEAKGSVRYLTFDECKVYHALMTKPVNFTEDATIEGGDVETQRLRCVKTMLGQPVKLGTDGFAIVRIALGADMVIQALKGEKEVGRLRNKNTVMY